MPSPASLTCGLLPMSQASPSIEKPLPFQGLSLLFEECLRKKRQVIMLACIMVDWPPASERTCLSRPRTP
jgi:hypothetical protein